MVLVLHKFIVMTFGLIPVEKRYILKQDLIHSVKDLFAYETLVKGVNDSYQFDSTVINIYIIGR